MSRANIEEPDGGGDPKLLTALDKAKDAARTVASSAVSAVPFAGGPLATLLEAAWPSVWQCRVERLILELDRRLGQLHAEVLRRDEVATVAALAFQAAIVSDDDKIAYLAAAVANVATNADEWEHDLVVVLMRLVRDLTATHVRVLDLLADPSAWIKRTGVLLEQRPGKDGGFRLADDVALAFRNAGTPVADLPLIVHDLEALGLLNSTGLGDANPSQHPVSLSADLVSDLGHRVRFFVS